jgi:hypothetical protein
MNKAKLREKRSRLRSEAQRRKHKGIAALQERNHETARVNRIINEACYRAENEAFLDSMLNFATRHEKKTEMKGEVKE